MRELLLEDKTTGRNIIFACDTYENYAANDEISLDVAMSGIILRRTEKSKEEQKNRTKKKAEVFTPLWVCDEMINDVDKEFSGIDWKTYVDSKRLEITCGEAPYLVSRYDTTTGEFLPIEKRIGILDRKLRVVNENTDNETDWFKWAKRAFEATYGYEYQGDNLLLARENLLWTFIDYYEQRFDKKPPLVQIKQIANVVAWNIWQMDGLNDCVPFKTNILCKIKDWGTGQVFYFRELKAVDK